jgi:hypothetical protein
MKPTTRLWLKRFIRTWNFIFFIPAKAWGVFSRNPFECIMSVVVIFFVSACAYTGAREIRLKKVATPEQIALYTNNDYCMTRFLPELSERYKRPLTVQDLELAVDGCKVAKEKFEQQNEQNKAFEVARKKLNA